MQRGLSVIAEHLVLSLTNFMN